VRRINLTPDKTGRGGQLQHLRRTKISHCAEGAIGSKRDFLWRDNLNGARARGTDTKSGEGDLLGGLLNVRGGEKGGRVSKI